VAAASAETTFASRKGGVAAAVLAGGRGSRIGFDKANLNLAGATLAERAVASLRQAGLDPFVVTKSDRPVAIDGVEVLVEADQPRHPLAGVAAAIRRADGRQVIVLACDLPLIPPAFFAWLAGLEGGSVVPCPGGESQPLAARYSPADLEPIEAALRREAPVREAAADLSATLVGDRELAAFGDPAVMFTNLNTPEDLRRVEGLIARS
jgi:molybdopterin-guanine dinucleotide biosynthesis protein A